MQRINDLGWMENGGQEVEGGEDGVSWSRANGINTNGEGVGVGLCEFKDEMGLSSFKSLLEDDWYLTSVTTTSASAAIVTTPTSNTNNNTITPSNTSPSPHLGFEPIQTHQNMKTIAFSSEPSPNEAMLLQPQGFDSSSSCSPSSVFSLDPSLPFFPQKNTLTSLLSAVCSNPFDANFDLGFDESGFMNGAQVSNSTALLNKSCDMGSGVGIMGFGGLDGNGRLGCSDLSPNAPFHAPRLMELTGNSTTGFDSPLAFGGFENSLFLNRSKVLQPLDMFPPGGAHPTLFQKRAAALQQNSTARKGVVGKKGGNLGVWGSEDGGHGNLLEEHWKGIQDDELEDASYDGSGLNYDSDEVVTENVKSEDNGINGGANESNANSTLTGDGEKKGKKKGLPAKNLMAERRRRKKLNDRLYMLRSVVPRISKMDRASILGDAIEYLKELLQRINDLHNELESSPSTSSLPTPTAASFQPLTPAPPTLPCRVKEELCASSMPSPNSQPSTVEVRVREGGAVNIHMFCVRRPGLLLSTMRALEGMGLDIHQAVISCFNGFALDIFRAEQCKDGPSVPPDDIKALLLHSAGLQGTM